MIELVAMALQIIIAVVIFAVWIFRPNLQTNYRAGNAKNIFEDLQFMDYLNGLFMQLEQQS